MRFLCPSKRLVGHFFLLLSICPSKKFYFVMKVEKWEYLCPMDTFLVCFFLNISLSQINKTDRWLFVLGIFCVLIITRFASLNSEIYLENMKTIFGIFFLYLYVTLSLIAACLISLFSRALFYSSRVCRFESWACHG